MQGFFAQSAVILSGQKKKEKKKHAGGWKGDRCSSQHVCVSVKFWTSLKVAAGLRSCKGFEVILADCMFGNLSSFLLWLNALSVTLGIMSSVRLQKSRESVSESEQVLTVHATGVSCISA